MLNTTEQGKPSIETSDYNKSASILTKKSALKNGRKESEQDRTDGDVSDVSGHVFDFKNVQDREKLPNEKTEALTQVADAVIYGAVVTGPTEEEIKEHIRMKKPINLKIKPGVFTGNRRSMDSRGTDNKSSIDSSLQ